MRGERESGFFGGQLPVASRKQPITDTTGH